MSVVTVVGIDGRPLPAAVQARLAEAGLVVGAGRHLDAVARLLPGSARRLPLGELAPAVDAIADCAEPVVVLASGDPGFFGIVRRLRAAGLKLDVLPAVSSVAAAFARLGLSWDDATVVSAHGRDLRRAVNVCRARRKVAVLTGPGSGPGELAAALRGWPRRMVVAERLGEADESVVELTPEQAAGREWREPNVVLVLAETTGPGSPGWSWPPRQTPTSWALPEKDLRHRHGQITKVEVRALALAHLGPGLGDLVWDVGCGSGSVAVECARFEAAVVAVDRDPDQLDSTRTNSEGAGVDVRLVHGQAPEVLAELPDPDAVYVGGGGPDVVAACARRAARSVVVGLAAVDRVAPTRAALANAGLAVGGTQLAASRLAELPDGSSRLAATNPVFLLWGTR